MLKCPQIGKDGCWRAPLLQNLGVGFAQRMEKMVRINRIVMAYDAALALT